MTLSPPIRIFAGVGVLAAVGLGAFLFFSGRGGGDSSVVPATPSAPATKPVTPTPAQAPATSPATRPEQTNRAAATPASGFPVPVDRALKRNRVVVVVVYMPGAAVDAVVRSEAKAAARLSGAGLVQLSALSERLVQPLVAKTGVLPDPAVVVLRRPDRVVATLSVTDRQTIAQAVAQARG